jgi:hypothetical protein
MAKKEKATPRHEVTKRRLARWQKERRRRRIIITAGTLVIALVLAIIGYGFYATSIAPGKELVTTVGGRDFHTDDYVRTLRLYPPSEDSVDPARETLEALEDIEILWQGASYFNIIITYNDVTQGIRDMIEEEKGETLTDEEFEEIYQQLLSSIELSEEEYREGVKTGLIQEKLSDHFLDQVPQSAEQVHVEVIMGVTQEEVAEVMGNLSEGEDFTSIAARLGGGDLGWLPRGIMGEEFDGAAFDPDLELDTVKPFDIDEAWYIIRVLEREEERAIDEVRRDQLAAIAFSGWLEEERESKVERSWKYDSENPEYVVNLANLYQWALDEIG